MSDRDNGEPLYSSAARMTRYSFRYLIKFVPKFFLNSVQK